MNAPACPLEVLHDEMVELNDIHVEYIKIVLAVGIVILGADMLQRFEEMREHLLILYNLAIVSLCLHKDHPTKLLKRIVMPVLESVHCIRIFRNTRCAITVIAVIVATIIPSGVHRSILY